MSDPLAVCSPIPSTQANVRSAPVFLVGVHRRCGSNFVCDALQLHKQFSIPEPLTEDYLLENAHLLHDYVERTVASRWRKRFNAEEDVVLCRKTLCRRLGAALTSTLAARIAPGSRLLTKTPDPDNVKLFPSLFPDAKLVLIVRDGRDVVESSFRSWPSQSYAHWMRMWAKGARTILDFVNGAGKQCKEQWRLVRYEDLLHDREAFGSLLDFLGVSRETYPWDELESLPVRGSSTHRGNASELHWRPVEKTADFRPVGRWANWSLIRRLQFKAIAGAEQTALGYPLF